MSIRNRLIALSLRVVLFAITIVSLVMLFKSGTAAWKLLCYSSIQCGVLLALVLGFEIIFNAIDLRHGIYGLSAGIRPSLSLGVTLYCLISGVLFFTSSGPLTAYKATDIFFGVVLLAVPTIDWLLICEKGTVRWYMGFNYIFGPLFYFAFVIFRAMIWPEAYLFGTSLYPYQSMDPNSPNFFRFCLICFGVILASGFLIILLNNLLSGKYKKAKNIN